MDNLGPRLHISYLSFWIDKFDIFFPICILSDLKSMKTKYNNMSDDWVSLNIQQNFNGQNEQIQILNQSNYKVGKNLLVNRFQSLNNKIDYSWFNESFESFKIKDQAVRVYVFISLCTLKREIVFPPSLLSR